MVLCSKDCYAFPLNISCPVVYVRVETATCERRRGRFAMVGPGSMDGVGHYYSAHPWQYHPPFVPLSHRITHHVHSLPTWPPACLPEWLTDRRLPAWLTTSCLPEWLPACLPAWLTDRRLPAWLTTSCLPAWMTACLPAWLTDRLLLARLPGCLSGRIPDCLPACLTDCFLLVSLKMPFRGPWPPFQDSARPW